MLHSPTVQLGKSKGYFHPSQVQTAPLHQSTQSTTQFVSPPTSSTATPSTNLPMYSQLSHVTSGPTTSRHILPPSVPQELLPTNCGEYLSYVRHHFHFVLVST